MMKVEQPYRCGRWVVEGWILHDRPIPQSKRRQQGGGIMIWAGIVSDLLNSRTYNVDDRAKIIVQVITIFRQYIPKMVQSLKPIAKG